MLKLAVPGFNKYNYYVNVKEFSGKYVIKMEDFSIVIAIKTKC